MSLSLSWIYFNEQHHSKNWKKRLRKGQQHWKSSYFRISSRHCLCVAKQAMAHILISTPVWNCFPLMSHTPWLGVATVRFWNNIAVTPHVLMIMWANTHIHTVAHTPAWAGRNNECTQTQHIHTLTQTHTYFLKTHRIHRHSSSLPECMTQM